jgi:hypothetical protein
MAHDRREETPESRAAREETARHLTIPPETLSRTWLQGWRAPRTMRATLKSTYYLTPLDVELLEELVTWFWREAGGQKMGKGVMMGETIRAFYLTILRDAAISDGYTPEEAQRIAVTALNQRFAEIEPAADQATDSEQHRWYHDTKRLERFGDRVRRD